MSAIALRLTNRILQNHEQHMRTLKQLLPSLPPAQRVRVEATIRAAESQLGHDLFEALTGESLITFVRRTIAEDPRLAPTCTVITQAGHSS